MLDFLAGVVVSLGEFGKDGNSVACMKFIIDEPECPESLIK